MTDARLAIKRMFDVGLAGVASLVLLPVALLVALLIRLVEKHRAQLDHTIATAFAAHPEAHLFEALPGAAGNLEHRLA